MQDLSKKAMKERFEYEKRQEIPIGTDEYIRDDLGEYNFVSVCPYVLTMTLGRHLLLNIAPAQEYSLGE